VTLKILIGRFSRNFFSGTAERIELKSGVYVPMNVFKHVLLLFAPFENSKWPPTEVKVCTETLWETTFSSSS
jgi:hypothetical protein